MIRNKLDMNESLNSAPFSIKTFLNAGSEGFFSARSMMNSAEIGNEKVNKQAKEITNVLRT